MLNTDTTTFWILFAVAAIPSIILHEVAHGYVAYLCGDDTAKRAGRLTLNPVSHIDPFGTIILPIILVLLGLPALGYARPVPINLNKLRKPRNQSVWVALAGPGTNFILSFLAAVAVKIMLVRNVATTSDLFLFFLLLGYANLMLGCFNLVPIPPLDGSALLERLWPRKHLKAYFEFRARALPVAMIVMLAVIFFFGLAVATALENAWVSLVEHL